MFKAHVTQVILFLLLCLITYFARAQTDVAGNIVTLGQVALPMPSSAPNLRSPLLQEAVPIGAIE
jgi:hypothetical protein